MGEKKELSIDELIGRINGRYKHLDGFPCVLSGITMPLYYIDCCKTIYGLQDKLISKLLEELALNFFVSDHCSPEGEGKKAKYTRQLKEIRDEHIRNCRYTLPQIVIPDYQNVMGWQRRLIDKLLEEKKEYDRFERMYLSFFVK